MKSNIRYANFTKLMSPEEVWNKGKGSCHDQCMFEDWAFSKMKIQHGKLFLIEYNDGEDTGGRTHTLLYYKENNKIYWFENSWEGQIGIHGPYNSMNELKKDVETKMLKDSKYKNVEFAKVKNIKVGMTLGEYVDSCLNNN